MGASDSKVKVYGYDESVDPGPRVGAIVLLVLYSLMIAAIVIETAVTRDWCVTCSTLTDREANVDWGLLLFSGWLCGGLLHMIQCPGSKIGFIMTILMAAISIGLSIVQQVSAWGRFVDCKNNTILGDTEFCDQNYHNKPMLLTVSVLGLILGAFELGILILAAVWYSRRNNANLFPEEMISMTLQPPPANFYAGTHVYAPIPPPVQHFAPPTNAAAAVGMYHRGG